MSLNVTITFSDPIDVGAGLEVRRYDLCGAIGELFELAVEVYSTDPSIAESNIVGQPVVVDFVDEPFVKQIRGIVRHMEQRTAVLNGDSHYVWTIVPPLWLTTRRRDNRIFQNMSATDIVDAVLADSAYGGRIEAPAKTLATNARSREYVVQYDETDWSFLARILADEGIASYFDHKNDSQWVLIDDTSTLAPDGPRMRFCLKSRLDSTPATAMSARRTR